MMLDIKNLTLDQIKEILGLEDNRSVKTWLKKHGIPISQIGRKKMVNQFMFDFKQQQLAVEGLRISYPNNWFQIYEANTPDKGMVKAISELYPQTKKIKKVNKNGENYIV